MDILTDKMLVNLGVISLLADRRSRIHRELTEGTFLQDIRLNLEKRLLDLIVRNYHELGFSALLVDEWYARRAYVDKHGSTIYQPPSFWNELVAMQVDALKYERQIMVLYERGDNYYRLHPGTDEEVYIYYNLSTQQVIELSRELRGEHFWFLGFHEVLCDQNITSEVELVRKKYSSLAPTMGEKEETYVE